MTPGLRARRLQVRPACRRRATATRCAVAVLSLACTAAMAEPAPPGSAGLSVVAVPPQPATGTTAGRWIIYLDGYLDSDSASRVTETVARHEIPDALVYLNSPGGSLLAGIAIGQLLRRHGFDTEVGTRTADPRRPTTGVCYSACPFAYAGGARRGLAPGSLLGVHRAENRVPLPDASAFERRVQDDALAYLEEMGVSPQLYSLMAQVPPGRIRLLSLTEATRLSLVNSPGATTAR